MRMRVRFSTVTDLRLATFAVGVEFARHPSDKTAVLYPNLPERIDGEFGDVENLPITRHIGGMGSATQRKMAKDKTF
jgi:hypothetical protein